MFERPHSGVAGEPPRGVAVIDYLFENCTDDDGRVGSGKEPVQDEHEAEGRDSETDYENEGRPAFDRWGLNDAPGVNSATSLADNTWCSMSDDDDFNLDFNFTTAVLLDPHGDENDGYKWGEPVGRDPHMWGTITLSGAPEYLDGEPLVGAKLTIECWWQGDDPYGDVYEFAINIEGGVHASPLNHIRERSECVKHIDPLDCPPADIVIRAIDAKRRRDLESLRTV